MLSNSSTPLSKFIFVFLQKQTYLNIVYLSLNIVFGFTYYLILQIGLSLSWGLIFPTLSIMSSSALDWIPRLKLASVVLGGLLVIPSFLAVLQLSVFPEQALANLLLAEKIPLTGTSSKDPHVPTPWRFLSTAFSWKRLLYVLLKIPLGGISFLALFNLLIPAIAMFGMPLAYLVGFRNLIIGPWRFDTVEKVLLAFLAGLLLVPISLHCVNLLTEISGWLAKTLLSASER